jgi:hypothetical protein
MTRQIAFAALLLLALGGAASADNAMDRQFNEEAIQRYVQEADPDVGYLVRLKMMKGHLGAAKHTLHSGDLNEAAAHVSHPITEIWNDLAPALAKRNVNLRPTLERAMAAAETGNTLAITAAIDESLALIAKAEQMALSNGADKLAPDVIAILLRTAVVEYHEAFEGTKLRNTVEYHDGAFFVKEARAMLAELEPALRQKDNAAFAKMTTTLEKLYTAWPDGKMPEKLILPITKMQSLVSIAELQLNKLR